MLHIHRKFSINSNHPIICLLSKTTLLVIHFNDRNHSLRIHLVDLLLNLVLPVPRALHSHNYPVMQGFFLRDGCLHYLNKAVHRRCNQRQVILYLSLPDHRSL